MEALEDHPIAALFPLLDAEQADALAQDILANGQQEDIVLFEGKILDGRNRYRACIAVNETPITKEYQGADPVGFVVSHNIHRRHLTTSQRAMIAAELANMKHGGDRRSDQAAILPLETQESAAQKLNVSEKTVRDAVAVKTHGTPALQDAVRNGDMSVSAAAKIARPQSSAEQLEKVEIVALSGEVMPKPGQAEKPLSSGGDSATELMDADQLRRMKRLWRKTELSRFWSAYTPENKRALLEWIKESA